MLNIFSYPLGHFISPLEKCLSNPFLNVLLSHDLKRKDPDPLPSALPHMVPGQLTGSAPREQKGFLCPPRAATMFAKHRTFKHSTVVFWAKALKTGSIQTPRSNSSSHHDSFILEPGLFNLRCSLAIQQGQGHRTGRSRRGEGRPGSRCVSKRGQGLAKVAEGRACAESPGLGEQSVEG